MNERTRGDIAWFCAWACLLIALTEPEWYIALPYLIAFVIGIWTANELTGIEEVRR